MDIVFVACSLTLMFFAGWPIASLLPPVPARLYAAPIFGFAVCGIVTSAAYAHGLSTDAGFALCLGLAMVGVGVLIRSHDGVSHQDVGLAIAQGAAGVALVALLPAWIGGPRFTVFQGNSYDQFNYIGMAQAMMRHSFADAGAGASHSQPCDGKQLQRHGGTDAAGAVPQCPIVFGSLLTLFRGVLPIELSYAYNIVSVVLVFLSVNAGLRIVGLGTPVVIALVSVRGSALASICNT